MTSLNATFDVAVVDEIQQLRDQQRGWAWTRALLGLRAREVHLCGEAAALPLVRQLAGHCGEEVEVHTYERLTGLTVESEALGSLANTQPGDCFVCFNRRSIQAISGAIRRMGKEVAIIYGGLPPNTKMTEAAAFNDPEHSCSVMVATDAIGMGLNLSIRRVIFASLYKPALDEQGVRGLELISVSQALQIAGRAGRYRTRWEEGFVTTLKHEELPVLKQLLASQPEPIEQAGLHPTAEQIEMFAYHMPHLTMSGLVDLFQNLCRVDDIYFMCELDNFNYLADLIQGEDVPLRARYVFCCAPISSKKTFLCHVFGKMVRQFAMGVPCSAMWMCETVGWPFKQPTKLSELEHLEQVFDCFDLYLWLSYRFPDMFAEQEAILDLQSKMDELFAKGIRLIGAANASSKSGWGSKKMATSKRKTDGEPEAGEAADSTISDTVESPSQSEASNIDISAVGADIRSLNETSNDSSQAVSKKQKKKQKSKKRAEEDAPPPADLSCIGGGKLAKRLVAKGLISSSMLAELQREMAKNEKRQHQQKKRGKRWKPM